MNRLVAPRADPEMARTYWTMGRGDGDRAFREARRHSRLVRRLRIALPIALVVLLGGISLWTWINPLRVLAGAPISMSDVLISGTKLTMEHPKLAGFTRDARPYNITAKAAAQDLKRPDLVELRDLHATFQMEDKSTGVLIAPDGTFNSKKDTLSLGKTELVMSNGYKVWLESAEVDIRSSNVISERPVEVEMLQGKVNSNRLEMTGGGALIVFEGNVRMTLQLNSASPEAETAAR
jgi:lipopolysaccharide export system protein LptC